MATTRGGGVVLGYLKYVLGFDSLAFEKGLDDAGKKLAAAQRNLQRTADSFKDVGAKLSTYISLPIAGAAAAVIKLGGDFESSMNKVAISTQGSAAELKAMNALALKLGKDTAFGASEAADAMDELAKNGLSARQVLDGAATAAVNLAAAAGSELSPAAKAISDVMQQFKIGAADLPAAVNQITGAVNQSKLDFVDFAGAIAQAGGIAGSVGVSFQDFNAAIASTSALFSSGSDAGTSFKTFLLALPGNSKPAIKAIEEYKLKFYDATGSMRSMAEIAEELRTKLGGLSDEAKTTVLKDIFGNDAMRTAIGLMDQGAKGIDTIKAKIAATDAAAQSAQRLKGFNGQLEQLKGSLETLAITIAQSGILEAVTTMVTGFANFVDKLSETSPEVLKFGTIFAGLAALIGPVTVGIGIFISSVSSILGVLGPLLPVLGGTGLAGALGAIGVALAPLAAGIAAAAAGWALFGDKLGPVFTALGSKLVDTLGPKLANLFATLSQAASDLWNGPFGTALKAIGTIAVEYLGDFLAAFNNALGSVFITTLAVAVDALTAAFQLIADAIRVVAKLLTGDFSGAWEAAKALVSNYATNILRVFENIVPGVTDAMKRLYEGVRTWIVDRLGGIWTGVRDKINEVKGWFFGLYDAVVGHSYIPDMVDEIGQNMARLDAMMVDPAAKATKKTGDHFDTMATRLKSILDGLYPETAKLRKELEDLAALQGSTSMSAVAQADAIRKQQEKVDAARQAAREETAPPLIYDPGVIDGVTKEDGVGITMPEFDQEALNRFQENFRSTFRDGVHAALDGDLKGFFEHWLADVATKGLDRALDHLSEALFNLISKGGSASSGGGIGGILGGVIKSIGGGIGGGSSVGLPDMPVLPDIFHLPLAGFRANGGAVSAGRNYVVGERGPEMFTASRSGYITANDNMRESGRRNAVVMHNDFRGADAAAVAGISAKLDQLDRSFDSRAIGAYVDARDRRIVR